MKKFIFIILMTVYMAVRYLNAQVQPDSVQLAEMQKLDIMLGKWEGEGWIELTSGERNPFLARISIRNNTSLN